MKKYLLACVMLLLPFSGMADEGENMLWIDVRSAEEYQSGHHPAAINIPHTEIVTGIAAQGAAKDQPIRLYCRSGGRAGIAKQALESAGFTNVTNEGGFDDVMSKTQ